MIFGAINKLATLRNLARTVVVVLMVLCEPFPLSADQPSEGYTQANEAYLKGEYPKAIALLRPLVEKGEAGPPEPPRPNVYEWTRCARRLRQGERALSGFRGTGKP